MAEHDPLDRALRALAAEAEQHIGDPMDASRVRRLGAQRRRRRFTAIAAASVAALALSGGVVFSTIIDGTQEQPSPAQPPGITVAPTPTVSPTPTPSPTPTATPTKTPKPEKSQGPTAGPPATTTTPPSQDPPRTVTQENLLLPSDIPTGSDEQQVSTTGPADGRSVSKSSVCLTDGLDELDASEILSRNFRISVPDESSSTAEPGNELVGQPSIYTQVLQFSSDNKASDALETYRGWIDECDDVLGSRGYTVLGNQNGNWYRVDTGVDGASGGFAELTYRAPGQSEDLGWWEAIGLTQRDDRLMITISLAVGQDKNVAYEQYPADPDLVAPHEQYPLIIAAAERLGD